MYGLIILLLWAGFIWGVVAAAVKAVRKVKFNQTFTTIVKKAYRNSPDNASVQTMIGLFRSRRTLSIPREQWNQMRNLLDRVESSPKVDSPLKDELRREMLRLGLTVMNARQQHGTTNVEAQRAAGQAGEKETAYQLQFLGADYRVFNGLYLSAGGQRQEFDHIVIGRNGIFHIDSKNYGGNLVFTATGLEQDGQPVDDPTTQLHRHEYVLRELLKDAGIDDAVVGVICFVNDRAMLTGTSPDFLTVKIGRLLSAIKGYAGGKTLSPDDIERVASLIEAKAQTSIAYQQA